MTNNTGKVKKYKKKFNNLDKKGARLHRRNFIESEYIDGIKDHEGSIIIRPLNKEEISWLDSFYKEYIHTTFITDKDSTSLFKKIKKMSKSSKNLKHLELHGEDCLEVKQLIQQFNQKSKDLGNVFYKFEQQRELNSNDYKRKNDIQNNCLKGVDRKSVV